jgi:HrpA-like RNA helicase
MSAQSDGQCYRLYSQAGFAEFEDAQQPEIQRCELDFALLHLLAAGQQDVTAFEYMDRPDDEASACRPLYSCGLAHYAQSEAP